MADGVNVNIDNGAVLRALDTIGDRAEAELFAAAMETGKAIQREARSRFARQTSGTGQTAKNITVMSDADSGPPFGVVVFIRPVLRPENLPLWFEEGTVRMAPQPFFEAAGALEEGPHRRRIADALDRAVKRAGG